MLILRRCLVASAILVVALWLLWWASAGFPARIEVCETGGKPCGSYNFPLGSILKVVTILDRYGALITACSTIAIAIFTYILYGATNALVAVERDRRSTVGGGGAKALHDPNIFTIVATNAGPGSAILRRLLWGFEDLGVIPPTPRYDGGDIADVRRSARIPCKQLPFGKLMLPSLLCTDQWTGYRKLKAAYPHKVIHHTAGEYIVGAVHTNTIEGVWSIFNDNIFAEEIRGC
jgi:hypothetical protein